MPPKKKSQTKAESARMYESPSSGESIDSEEEEEQGPETFEIEKILDDKIIKGQKQQQLKWKDYPSSENSWEPKTNIQTPEIISQQEKEKRIKKAELKKMANDSSLIKIPQNHTEELLMKVPLAESKPINENPIVNEQIIISQSPELLKVHQNNQKSKNSDVIFIEDVGSALKNPIEPEKNAKRKNSDSQWNKKKLNKSLKESEATPTKKIKQEIIEIEKIEEETPNILSEKINNENQNEKEIKEIMSEKGNSIKKEFALGEIENTKNNESQKQNDFKFNNDNDNFKSVEQQSQKESEAEKWAQISSKNISTLQQQTFIGVPTQVDKELNKKNLYEIQNQDEKSKNAQISSELPNQTEKKSKIKMKKTHESDVQIFNKTKQNSKNTPEKSIEQKNPIQNLPKNSGFLTKTNELDKQISNQIKKKSNAQNAPEKSIQFSLMQVDLTQQKDNKILLTSEKNREIIKDLKKPGKQTRELGILEGKLDKSKQWSKNHPNQQQKPEKVKPSTPSNPLKPDKMTIEKILPNKAIFSEEDNEEEKEQSKQKIKRKNWNNPPEQIIQNKSHDKDDIFAEIDNYKKFKKKSNEISDSDDESSKKQIKNNENSLNSTTFDWLAGFGSLKSESLDKPKSIINHYLENGKMYYLVEFDRANNKKNTFFPMEVLMKNYASLISDYWISSSKFSNWVENKWGTNSINY